MVAVNALVSKAVLLLAAEHLHSTTVHTPDHVFSTHLQNAQKLLQSHA